MKRLIPTAIESLGDQATRDAALKSLYVATSLGIPLATLGGVVGAASADPDERLRGALAGAAGGGALGALGGGLTQLEALRKLLPVNSRTLFEVAHTAPYVSLMGAPLAAAAASRAAMPAEEPESVMERTASYSREVGALDALSLLGIKTANLGLQAMRKLLILERARASPAVESAVMRSLTPAAVEGSVVKQIAQRTLPGISPPTAEYAETLRRLGIAPNVKAEAPRHAADMQRLYDRFVGSGSLRG